MGKNVLLTNSLAFLHSWNSSIDQPMSPEYPPILASTGLGVQTCTTMPSFFTWVLGLKLGSPHLCRSPSSREPPPQSSATILAYFLSAVLAWQPGRSPPELTDQDSCHGCLHCWNPFLYKPKIKGHYCLVYQFPWRVMVGASNENIALDIL